MALKLSIQLFDELDAADNGKLLALAHSCVNDTDNGESGHSKIDGGGDEPVDDVACGEIAENQTENGKSDRNSRKCAKS